MVCRMYAVCAGQRAGLPVSPLDLLESKVDVLCSQARSSVQLKDKWRNLVKFKRLSEKELNYNVAGGLKNRASIRQCVLTHLH